VVVAGEDDGCVGAR